ncbi:hypothetical protein [Halorussus salinisoli]|uniref:hypothetical protein n=1 Tax=Halorussus salinisoli TaxID=2558242 RepID=UPI0010C1A6AB|nr:hypothetical protein [Halorussus salinisoli]
MQELILRIIAIALSVSIALTPWWYPNHSPFVRRVLVGIETLQTPRVTEDDIEAGYIEQGEKGFSQVEKAAEAAYGLYGDVERIWLVCGPPPSITDFAGLNQELGGFGDNGLVYAEQSNGETIRLRYRAGGPQQTRRLEDLHAGAAHVAQQRGQKLTSGLAILWATVMIVVVVL